MYDTILGINHRRIETFYHLILYVILVIDCIIAYAMLLSCSCRTTLPAYILHCCTSCLPTHETGELPRAQRSKLTECIRPNRGLTAWKLRCILTGRSLLRLVLVYILFQRLFYRICKIDWLFCICVNVLIVYCKIWMIELINVELSRFMQ